MSRRFKRRRSGVGTTRTVRPAARISGAEPPSAGGRASSSRPSTAAAIARGSAGIASVHHPSNPGNVRMPRSSAVQVTSLSQAVSRAPAAPTASPCSVCADPTPDMSAAASTTTSTADGYRRCSALPRRAAPPGRVRSARPHAAWARSADRVRRRPRGGTALRSQPVAVPPPTERAVRRGAACRRRSAG